MTVAGCDAFGPDIALEYEELQRDMGSGDSRDSIGISWADRAIVVDGTIWLPSSCQATRAEADRSGNKIILGVRLFLAGNECPGMGTLVRYRATLRNLSPGVYQLLIRHGDLESGTSWEVYYGVVHVS
jgi:hypothetical protein